MPTTVDYDTRSPSGVELAGERMRIEVDDAGTATIRFDDKGTGRQCGACQLCCKLVPVPKPLNKPAGVRCQHARAGKGCTIYPQRPFACRSWACLWLADPTTAGMPRPDRCHYVIDISIDYVTVQYDSGAEARQLSVLQVWVDPAFPDAHRAPELRAWLAGMGERWRCGAIIRWNSREAMVLFPPAISASRDWVESPVMVAGRTEEERAILGTWSAHFEGEATP